MYRNVYWHHAVRSANAMFKRGVQDLLHRPDCGLREADFDRATEADLIHRLEAEMSRLGVDRRESMVGRLKRRKLYKVARIFYPQERQEELMAEFARLYYDPASRRDLEIHLCRTFSERLGKELRGDEILIDIPRFSKSPQADLKVYFGSHIAVDKDDPLTFDDPEVSLLTQSIIDNFDAQAKVVRVFCVDHPELRAALKSEVKSHLMHGSVG
jgi:HD superfamily phosphohydrolase